MSFKDLTENIHSDAMGFFGEDLVIEYRSGNRQTLSGIFDRNHQVVDLNDVDVSSYAPVATFKLSDLSELPKQGDYIEVRKEYYKVSDVQTDGRGQLKLMLIRC